MSFRGVPLKKMGKRGVSGVEDAIGVLVMELTVFGISLWNS